MVPIKLLRGWLEGLPDDCELAIDCGGLTLAAYKKRPGPEAKALTKADPFIADYEVGGVPLANPYDSGSCICRDCHGYERRGDQGAAPVVVVGVLACVAVTLAACAGNHWMMQHPGAVGGVLCLAFGYLALNLRAERRERARAARRVRTLARIHQAAGQPWPCPTCKEQPTP